MKYLFLTFLILSNFEVVFATTSKFRFQVVNDFKTHDITTIESNETKKFSLSSNDLSLSLGVFIKTQQMFYFDFNRSVISTFNNSSYGLGYRYYFLGGMSLYFQNDSLEINSHHKWSFYGDFNYSKFSLNAGGLNLIFDQYEISTGIEYNIFEDFFLVSEVKAAYLYQSTIRDGSSLGFVLGFSKNF